MKVKVNTASHECSYTDEIICPFCGGEQADSWEFGSETNDWEHSSEYECGHCGREFIASRQITVEYSSRPITENDTQYLEWEKGDVFDDELNEEDEKWANDNGASQCEIVEDSKG